MDLIIREYQETLIKEMLMNSLKEAEKSPFDIISKVEGINDVASAEAYKVGMLKQTIESVLPLLNMSEDTLGTTGVIWTEEDIETKFNDRYNREPSKEEVKDIVDNYLNELNDIGHEVAIESGWNIIYSAFDDYEKDHKELADAV